MTYHLPTEIHFGDDSLDSLPECILPTVKRVAVVAGSSSFEPLRERTEALLSGFDVKFIDGISAEPEVSAMEEVVDVFTEFDPNLVIAIGGGSPMDTAKAAALFMEQSVSPREFLENQPETITPSRPVIAVPTTAGTGSEVTPFAVLWDHEAKKKYSIGVPELYPAHAIVDPLLTHSVPPYITACTGMDAFTQACEAYWNMNHNPTSDAFALEAIRLILPALPIASSENPTPESRHDMMLGSLRAGQAFSNTRTAACHSISYPMTLYYSVTHGQAVGITLPSVVRLNAEAMPEKVDAFLEAIGATDIQNAEEIIRLMMVASGLKIRLQDLGIDEAGVETIVENGFAPERMKNNPHQFTAESLGSMLREIY